MIPIVSIICPSYNKQNYIGETIESVLKQDYKEWELLIIDDQSSDNTVNIVTSLLQKDKRIKLFANTENKGANYCRNFGIEQSTGKFIVFLDADDLLTSNCLKVRVSHMEETNIDFCVFSMGTFKQKIGDNNFQWIPFSKKPLKDFFKHKLPWSILQPIWKKDFLVKIGGFDIQFERLQDVELHTRALLQADVEYKQIQGKPDCYYRIEEKRKNFNIFLFLNKWVSSSRKYYAKFYSDAVVLGVNKSLMGTIYKTYLQLLYHFKRGEISREELSLLENQLLGINMSDFERNFFKISKVLNLLPIRLPGINWIVNKVITH